MGYYTNYSLEAKPWTDELKDYLYENSDKYYGIYCDGSTTDSCKWYLHETDMRFLSLKFPDTHLILKGTGEEPGDIWEKHFLNGKMQVCTAEIIIPPFDERKLC